MDQQIMIGAEEDDINQIEEQNENHSNQDPQAQNEHQGELQTRSNKSLQNKSEQHQENQQEQKHITESDNQKDTENQPNQLQDQVEKEQQQSNQKDFETEKQQNERETQNNQQVQQPQNQVDEESRDQKSQHSKQLEKENSIHSQNQEIRKSLTQGSEQQQNPAQNQLNSQYQKSQKEVKQNSQGKQQQQPQEPSNEQENQDQISHNQLPEDPLEKQIQKQVQNHDERQMQVAQNQSQQSHDTPRQRSQNNNSNQQRQQQNYQSENNQLPEQQQKQSQDSIFAQPVQNKQNKDLSPQTDNLIVSPANQLQQQRILTNNYCQVKQFPITDHQIDHQNILNQNNNTYPQNHQMQSTQWQAQQHNNVPNHPEQQTYIRLPPPLIQQSENTSKRNNNERQRSLSSQRISQTQHDRRVISHVDHVQSQPHSHQSSSPNTGSHHHHPAPAQNHMPVPVPVPAFIPLRQQQQKPQQQKQVPPHDDFAVMILPLQGFDQANIGTMYSSAFQERRQINRRMMIEFLEKRNSYYLTHIGVFDHIKLGLRLRVRHSKEAVESFRSFYQQQIQNYKPIVSSMKYISQLSAKTQTQSLRVHWSPAVTAGIYKNIQNQSSILEMMKSYRLLIKDNVIEPLQQAYNEFYKIVEEFQLKAIEKRKQFSNFEQKIVGLQKEIHKKFKGQQKYPGKTVKSYDLTEEEIVLFRQMKVTNLKLSNWGSSVIEWWKQQIQQQIKLLFKIKQLVGVYVDISNKLHIITPDLRNRCSTWIKEDVRFDVLSNFEFENIVCLTDIDFVRGSLQTYNGLSKPDKLTIEDIQTFNLMKYDEKITGKRDIIIECLIAKQFKCKKITPGKQQLQKAKLLATIDDNLLIIDSKQSIIKGKLRQLMNTRPEGNQVKINIKRRGWFSDDWESVLLQFKDSDSAQQFMFFTETDPEVKKEYVI